MNCTACGHQSPEDAHYCSRCGAYLVREHAAESTMPITLPGVGRDPESHVPVEPSGGQGAALLVRSGGNLEGQRYMIPDKMTIGRSPVSDVFLDDVTVSREHAVLFNDGSGVRIEDRASLNGTFVNHERVEKRRLDDGDEIQIGKFKLIFIKD